MNFKDMSLEKLLTLCNNNFFDVVANSDDFFEYLCEISKKVCDKYSCSEYPSVYKTIYVDQDHKKLSFSMAGHYDSSSKHIYLSRHLVDTFFKEFASRKNFYYVFMGISAIIHETRHYIQYNNIDPQIDPIVKNYTAYLMYMPTQVRRQEQSYFMRPDEIDARAYVFELLNGIPLFYQYLSTNEKMTEKLALRAKSSVARSINETYRNIDQVERWGQMSVYKMNKAYSKFLQTIGLDRADLELPPTITQPEALNGDPDNAELIKSVAEGWEQIIGRLNVSNKHALKDSITKIDGMLKNDNSFTNNQRQEVGALLKVFLLSRYENERLYERLSPGFYKLVHCNDWSCCPEIDEFFKIYNQKFFDKMQDQEDTKDKEIE